MGAVVVVLVGPAGERVAALEAAGLTVHAVADPHRAPATVRTARAEVVVVDLEHCADTLGAAGAAVGVVTAVVEAVPEVRVLALVPDDGPAVLDVVKAGAGGALAGSAQPAELVDAVRRTADGESVFSPGLAEVVLEEYQRLAAGPAEVPRLTEREADVLRLVAVGLTARQIAGRLVLSPRTVENHIQHTLRKLHLHNRAELVRYAIEHGLG